MWSSFDLIAAENQSGPILTGGFFFFHWVVISKSTTLIIDARTLSDENSPELTLICADLFPPLRGKLKWGNTIFNLVKYRLRPTLAQSLRMRYVNDWTLCSYTCLLATQGVLLKSETARQMSSTLTLLMLLFVVLSSPQRPLSDRDKIVEYWVPPSTIVVLMNSNEVGHLEREAEKVPHFQNERQYDGAHGAGRVVSLPIVPG